MRVSRHQAVAVVNLDHLTILVLLSREHDLAAGRGDDGCPRIRRKIDPLVKAVLPGERIDPVTEVRRIPDVGDRRQRRWCPASSGNRTGRQSARQVLRLEPGRRGEALAAAHLSVAKLNASVNAMNSEHSAMLPAVQ